MNDPLARFYGALAAPSTQTVDDYTTGATVQTINDPRFRQDLRDFYEGRGVQGSDDELIERWKSDNRWREGNLASAAINAGRSFTQSDAQNMREARLARVWNSMPNFWEEGGAGIVDALADYIPAVLTDPTNLLPGGAAFRAGRMAAAGAEAAGQSALRAGITKGATEGAKFEAAISAGQGAAQSALEQTREQNLGLSQDFSVGRLATETALGAAFGAGVGGLIGGVAGGVGARGAGDRVNQLLSQEYTPEDISRMAAEPVPYSINPVSPSRTTEMETALSTQARNPAVVEAEAAQQAEQQAADLAAQRAMGTPAQQVQQLQQDETLRQQIRLNSYETALQSDYRKLMRAVQEARTNEATDPARLETLTRQYDDLGAALAKLDQLRNAPQIIQSFSDRIARIAASPDPQVQAQAAQMRREAVDIRAGYEMLFETEDTGDLLPFLNNLLAFDQRTRDVETAQAAAPPPGQATPPAGTPAGTPPAAPAATPAAATPAAAPTGAAPAGTPQQGAAPDPAATQQAAAAPKRGRKAAQAAQPAPQQASPEQPAAQQPAPQQPADGITLNQPTQQAQPDGTAPQNLQTQPAPPPPASPSLDTSSPPPAPSGDAPDAKPSNAAPTRKKYPKPAREVALREGVDIFKLPEGATVADVEAAAKAQRTSNVSVDADLERDTLALEVVISEIETSLPERLAAKYLPDRVFMSKWLAADERTAAYFDRILSLYETSQDLQASTSSRALSMAVGGRDFDELLTTRAAQIAAELMADGSFVDTIARQNNLNPRQREQIEAVIRQRAMRAAEAEAAGQRGDISPDDRPRAPALRRDMPRRTEGRMGDTTISTTAGLTASRFEADGQGGRAWTPQRVQAFLRIGQRVAKDRTITGDAGRMEGVRPKGIRFADAPAFISVPARRNFGYEEALLTARASMERAARTGATSKAIDVVRFVAGGPTPLAGGRTIAQAGDVLFLDAISGKAFRTYEQLLLRRGLSPAQAKDRVARAEEVTFVGASPEEAPVLPSDPIVRIERAAEQFKVDGDLKKFRATLARLNPAIKVPPQSTATINRDKPAGKRDGRILAIVSKSTGEVHVIKNSEARKGAGIEAIPEYDGNPDNWVSVYVQSNIRRADQIADAQRLAAPSMPRATPSERAAAEAVANVVGDEPDAVARPLTMDVEAFSETVIKLDPLADQNHIMILRHMADILGLQDVLKNLSKEVPEITGEHLHAMERRLDLERAVARSAAFGHIPGRTDGWDHNFQKYRTRLAAIEAINSLISRVAPAGVAQSNNAIATAQAQLDNVLARYSKDVRDRARSILTALTQNAGIAPRFGVNENEASPDAYFRPSANVITLPRDSRLGDTVMPVEMKMMHEMAHWAYLNVLTPADRTDFWRSLGKFYGPDGNLDRAAVLEASAPGRGTMSDGTRVSAITNSAIHPQEYFANAFVAWASGRVSPEMGEASLWRRVSRYIQAIFDWFVSSKPVDPDLIPIFSKILPDAQQRIAASADDAAEPPTNAVREQALKELKELFEPPASPRATEPDAPASPDAATPDTAPAAPPAEPEAPAGVTLATPTREVRDIDTADLATLEKREQWLKLLGAQLDDPVIGIRPQWDAALKSGDPGKIIEAARQTASYLGKNFPRGASSANNWQGVTWIFTGRPGLRGSNRWAAATSRIRDINAILNGRDLEGARVEGGGQPTDEGLSTAAVDPKAVADKLTQLFYMGHRLTPEMRAQAEAEGRAVFEGGFTPAANARAVKYGDDGYDVTSIDHLLKQMSKDVEESMARNGRSVNFTKARARKAAEPADRSVAQRVVNDAVADGKATREAAVADAKARATEKGKARSYTTILGKKVDSTAATPLMDRTLDDLLTLYEANKGAPEGDLAAYAIVSKARAAVLPPDLDPPFPPKVLTAVKQLSNQDLEARYLAALEDNDTLNSAIHGYELQRRAANRALKAKPPADDKAALAMQIERADSLGPALDFGIPSSARPIIKEMLGQITMRDGIDQQASRTLAYRMLNLAGFAGKPEGVSYTPFTQADLLRIAGGTPEPEDAVTLADPQSAAFKSLRSQVRRVTSALTREGVPERDAMGSVAALAMRSLDEADRDIIARSFVAAGRSTSAGPEVQGEWFVDGLLEALAERTSLNELMPPGSPRELASELRAVTERVIDRMRYLSNGLVARDDIKSTYRRLFIFGDIFERAPGRPLHNAYPDGRLPSGLASAYVAELERAGGAAFIDNVRRFTGNGLGTSQDRPVAFFRSAPHSEGPMGGGLYARNVAVDSTNERTALDRALEGMSGRGRAVADILLADEAEYARSYQRISDETLDPVAGLDPERSNLLDTTIAAAGAVSRRLDEMGLPRARWEPVYISVQRPLRLDDDTLYEATSPVVASLLRQLATQGAMTQSSVVEMMAGLSRNRSFTGDQLLTQLRGALGPAAAQHLKTAARALNADGVTFSETLTDGTRATGVLAMDARSIKPASSPDFGVEPIPTHFEMRAMLADVTQAAFHGTGDIPASIAPVADVLAARVGGSNPITRAFAILGRNKVPNEIEQLELKKAAALQIQSNPARLHQVGFHAPAKFFETYYPNFNERLGKRLLDPSDGLLTAIGKLDDSSSVKRWLRRAKPFVTIPINALTGRMEASQQPASHAKIVRALRRRSGSPEERALSKQELGVYQHVRGAFVDAFNQIQATGFIINNRGPDYFPQVWSPDRIRTAQSEFLAAMRAYHRAEGDALGRTFDAEQTEEFAQRMYLTLTEEGADGTLMGPQAGGSRNSTADHIDHSRLIDLDRYPAARAALEPFLEDNLEAIVVKYFDAATRRMMLTERFGDNMRGFYDYMAVAAGGKDVIKRLLTTDAVIRRASKVMTEGGFIEDQTIVADQVAAPFRNREDLATQFMPQLMDTFNQQGPVAARELLYSLVRSKAGKVPHLWEKRADAIVDALQDFRGERARIHSDEFDFAENVARVAMRKPLSGNQTLIDASRYLRTFNSVTLLGFTVISSLGDLILPLVRSGQTSAYLRAINAYRTDPEYRRMFASTGVALESILNEQLGHLYGTGGTRWGTAFFYANGLTPWTNTMRQMSAAVGYETFKTMQEKVTRYPSNHREHQIARRFLNRYGLGEFATNRQSLGNRQLLTDSLPLRQAINRFADDAVFAPNPMDIPLWAQTPVGAIIFQLKSFPLMMQRLARDVLINDVALFLDPQRTGLAKALRVPENAVGDPRRAAMLLAVAPAFGAASLAIGDVVRGRGGEENKEHELRTRNLANFLGGDTQGEEWDILGWYLESLMMIGGAGLFLDMLHKTAQNVDNGAFGAQRVMSLVFGPSAGTFFSATNVLAGGMNLATNANDSNAPERTMAREIFARVPILGGVTTLREAAVDTVVGEADPYANL